MKNFTAFILILLAIICPAVANADLGPKPTMKFNIIFETFNQITLIGGQQYQCKDKSCLDIKPLGEYGPQRFTCYNNSCQSLAYGYDPYQKLVLNFTDKARESQVFSAKSFDAEFNVRVTDSQLIVEELNTRETISDNINNKKDNLFFFLISLIITIALELLVALTYLFSLRISKKLLTWVLVANLISLPIVWFIFPLIKIGNLIYPIHIIILSEIFAIIFETYFVYFVSKKQIMLRRSLILSILMNMVSLFLGRFIYFLIVN